MIILRSKILELPYTLENINKFKSKDNLLRHARYKPSKTKGIILIDRNTGSMIGYCGWENNWIIALEVSKDYRGRGFGNLLLEKAIDSGCTGLTVNKNNIIALNLYKKYGFIPESEVGNRINMILRK